MATGVPKAESSSLLEFTAALLAQPGLGPRARIIAENAMELATAAAALVYVLDGRASPQWVAEGFAGDIALEQPVMAPDSGTLGVLYGSPGEPLVFSAAELRREQYGHLRLNRTIASLAYVPLRAGERLVGALELITDDRQLARPELSRVMQLAPYAAVALSTAEAYERERTGTLQSVSRMSQLYDIANVLSSSLEMDDLLPVAPAKIKEILNVEAVNLWMVQGDESLLLASRAGVDTTLPAGTVQSTGGGIAAEVCDSGEPLLIASAQDERLAMRNEQAGGGAVFSLLAMPIVVDEFMVGAVEAINRLDGRPFDDDDQGLLTLLAPIVGNALHNASALQAERKVEILQALVDVSTEITSTLNLDRVMQAIVNGPQTVIPYERAAIAIEQNGKLRLGAVSGMTQVRSGDPEVKRLYELLVWAADANVEIHVTQHGADIDQDRQETLAKFHEYFSATGSCAFHALPLTDDQGRVGVLSLESSDPDFLSEAHAEMVKVLAGQATVALRNAQLYTELPFIQLLEPLTHTRRRFAAMSEHRRLTTAGLLVLAIVLALCPIPMRVGGDAVVGPARSARIQAEFDGVVRQVPVREGDLVRQSDVLAEMQDWEQRTALSTSAARYAAAITAMNRALSSNDGTEAGIQRVQADYWASETDRARERLEHTKLRSPIAGVIATPRVEQLIGSHVDAGTTLMDVVDTSRATVDVAISERDVRLLRVGAKADLKLDAFPTSTFSGLVGIVSPRTSVVDDERVFYARVEVPNAEGLIRPGMRGRGKLSVGWRPAALAVFRRPGMWIWSKLWAWFGW